MISGEKKTTRQKRKVPDYLVYEVMDGKPIYYRDYQAVLNKTKKPEDIIGSSLLQGVILNYILSILHRYLNQDEYWFVINEPGVHLDTRNNLAADILVYDRSRLRSSDINNRHANTPANIVVEVDTKAALDDLKFEKYLKNKTTRFHNFGVDKIIWVLTASKQVVVALPDHDWLMVDWNKDIEITGGAIFNIGGYLLKMGINVDENE